MGPNIQDFPDELLIEVIRLVAKVDLKQARLTRRRQRGKCSAEQLFQRVYFAPRSLAMKRFKNITVNPTYNRAITHLIYNGRLFPSHMSDDEYQAACLDQCEDGFSNPAVIDSSSERDDTLMISDSGPMVNYGRTKAEY